MLFWNTSFIDWSQVSDSDGNDNYFVGCTCLESHDNEIYLKFAF